MKISAVIPVYNGEHTIARAIDSVLAQTRPADEVIVIDDGSTDQTVKSVQAYGDTVILIQQQNAGASVTRNTGIEAATGDWIAFLDGDDEWLPDNLKLQSEHLAQHPDLEWTTANYYRCDCQQNHTHTADMSPAAIRQCRSVEVADGFFPDYLAPCAYGAKGHTDTMLIRRDLLMRAGLFLPGQKRMNDIDLWYRIAYLQPRFGFVYEPLAVYHLGVPNSIVKAHTDWHLIEQFLTRHLALAEQAGKSEQFRPVARIAMNHWMPILMNEGQGSGIRRLLQKHGHLMHPGYRRSCYLGSFCPALWTKKEKLKRNIRGVDRRG